MLKYKKTNYIESSSDASHHIQYICTVSMTGFDIQICTSE
jgi:hypothetical protein